MNSDPLAQQLRLPNGTTINNRIAKAATSEGLADPCTGRPNASLVRLYERLGAGGAGLIVTGNVIIDLDGRTGPGDVVISDRRDLDTLRRWAGAAQANGSKLFMQISHSGRQSPRRVTHRPIAPSVIRVQGKAGFFGTPYELSDADIRVVIERFALTAEIAAEAGFAGVQVNAAHGYLASQFLSPLTNHRTDRWGGSPEARMRFLLELVRCLRTRVGSSIAIAVKLNSADFQRGGFTTDDSMKVVDALEREGIDLLEISGGSYENAVMLNGQRESTKAREAYFLDYALAVRRMTKLPLMLTGGIRTAAVMRSMIRNGAVDVVGMARPLIVEPDLPKRILSGETKSALDIQPRVGIRLFDDMLQIAWYKRQLKRMAVGQEPSRSLGRWSTIAIGFARTYAFNPLGLLITRRRPFAQLTTGASSVG